MNGDEEIQENGEDIVPERPIVDEVDMPAESDGVAKGERPVHPVVGRLRGVPGQKRVRNDSLRRWKDLGVMCATTVKAREKEDETDYAFKYSDEQSNEKEISEFFSYWEWKELNQCHALFHEIHSGGVDWYMELSEIEKRDVFDEVLDVLEQNNDEKRRSNAQVLLYILLGLPEPCDQGQQEESKSNDNEKTGGLGLASTLKHLNINDRSKTRNGFTQLEIARDASHILLDCGGFDVLVQALCHSSKQLVEGAKMAEQDLRLYMNLVFLLVQLNRDRSEFCSDLAKPSFEETSLVDILVDMFILHSRMPKLCFPVKKIILLLWKTFLATMGDIPSLNRKKDKVREAAGLSPLSDEFHAKTRRYHSINFASQTEERVEIGAYYTPPGGDSNIPPPAVREGMKILKDSIYVPPSELKQRLQEKESDEDLPPLRALLTNPSPCEMFYRQLLPKLPAFCKQSLIVLLASLPMEEYKGELNVISEIGGESLKNKDIASDVEANMDAARHKEILSKAVTSMTLLLLKHMRFNHIYQFEYICQLLFDCNALLLIVKSLDHDVNAHVQLDGDISAYDTMPVSDSDCNDFGVTGPFPLKGLKVEDKEKEKEKEFKPFSWRNFVTVINLCRIAQKLTKRNPLRIKAIMQHRGTVTLKRLLNVKHPQLRLYALKLLKNQTKYLGQKWKRGNMKIISGIYARVRPEMVDDWLVSEFGEDDVSLFKQQDIDFQQLIKDFNQRNYTDYAIGKDGNVTENKDTGLPVEDFVDNAKYRGSVRGMQMLLRKPNANKTGRKMNLRTAPLRPLSSLFSSGIADKEFSEATESWLYHELLLNTTDEELDAEPFELLSGNVKQASNGGRPHVVGNSLVFW